MADHLQMAVTFQEATEALLHSQWDVLLVGAMFDESRGLELMRALASEELPAKVPVVGIRGSKVARYLHPELFDVPMKSLGAVDVIDFASIPDDAIGNAEIGVRIRAALSPKSPSA